MEEILAQAWNVLVLTQVGLRSPSVADKGLVRGIRVCEAMIGL